MYVVEVVDRLLSSAHNICLWCTHSALSLFHVGWKVLHARSPSRLSTTTSPFFVSVDP